MCMYQVALKLYRIIHNKHMYVRMYVCMYVCMYVHMYSIFIKDINSIGTLTDNDDSTGAIVGGVIGGICGLVLLMLIIILLWWFCIRNREKNSRPS